MNLTPECCSVHTHSVLCDGKGTRIITGLLLVHGMHSREQRRSLDWIRVKKLR